jgi:hypothetical protein
MDLFMLDKGKADGAAKYKPGIEHWIWCGGDTHTRQVLQGSLACNSNGIPAAPSASHHPRCSCRPIYSRQSLWYWSLHEDAAYVDEGFDQIEKPGMSSFFERNT